MQQGNMSFTFRNQTVTQMVDGVETQVKRPAVEVTNFPVIDAEDIINYLTDDQQTAVHGLITDAVNNIIYAAARLQVDEATFTELDLTKLDLVYIANLPRAQRSGAISKETWKAFESDYVTVITAVTGIDKGSADRAAKFISGKFVAVQHRKDAVAKLLERTHTWFANSTNQEAFAEVYAYIVDKGEGIINSEANLLDVL